MTTVAADLELRVQHLTSNAHELALWIVALDRTAQTHSFHGRVTLENAALERRQNLVSQRSLMLRELFVERSILRGWRR